MSEKYIHLVLSGGLGNQLFQYAFAKSLSIKYNLPISIDKGFIERDQSRVYKLNLFGVEERIVPDYLKMANWFWRAFRKIKIDKLFLKHVLKYDFHFQLPLDLEYKGDQVIYNSKSILIWGYWQNEKYFDNIKHDINDYIKINFKFKFEFESKYKYIAVHIRKGDYISNSIYSSIYNNLSSEYYLEALNLIKSEFNSRLKIILFSDSDIVDFSQKLEKFGFDVIVSNKLFNDELFDFWLMSKCDYNIIANSTFSWWAAYLNSNPEKVIFCPRNYFLDKSLNSKLSLYPNNWIKL